MSWRRRIGRVFWGIVSVAVTFVPESIFWNLARENKNSCKQDRESIPSHIPDIVTLDGLISMGFHIKKSMQQKHTRCIRTSFRLTNT